MRREDIFMDLIGELDDNYIALAMSRPKRRAIVSETRNITFVQPVEVEKNVSKRELRLYYSTTAPKLKTFCCLHSPGKMLK